MTKMSILCKRIGIFILAMVLFVWLLYQMLQETESNHSSSEVEKLSYNELEAEIILELRKIFFNPGRDAIANASQHAEESRKRLLANPNRKLHNIKRNLETIINTTGLIQYIQLLRAQNQDLYKEVMVLQTEDPKQEPSASAPIFMQDLPYRWSIAKYLLTPWKVEKRFTSKPPLKHQCFRPPQSSWKMIFVVKSWSVNGEIRDAIRTTWGQIASINGVDVHVVFLLAKPTSYITQTRIEEENEKFGDILQVDANEDTKYFTIRTVSGMAWVGQHFLSEFLYTSMDDNILPYLDRLIPVVDYFVKKAPPIFQCVPDNVLPFLCGFGFREKDKPSRNSKSPWYMPVEIYPPDVLPPHCQGGFYSTSISTVNLMVDESTKTYPSHYDAVWITGILRQKLGLSNSSIIDVSKPQKSDKKLVHYFESNIAMKIKRTFQSRKEELIKNNDVKLR